MLQYYPKGRGVVKGHYWHATRRSTVACHTWLRSSVCAIMLSGVMLMLSITCVALLASDSSCRPKHLCLAWWPTIFLYETFSRLVPRDPNLRDHTTSTMYSTRVPL